MNIFSEYPNKDLVEYILNNCNKNREIIDLTGYQLSFSDIDDLIDLISSGKLGSISNLYLRNVGLNLYTGKYLLSQLNRCILDRLNVVDISCIL